MRRPKFDFVTEAKHAFEGGAHSIDQGYHDLSLARLSSIVDEGDVTVTNMFVDHRIASHAQSVDTFRSHTSEQKARYGNHLDISNGVDWRPGGDATEERHFTNRIRGRLFDANCEIEAPSFVFALDHSTLLERRDVLCDRCF